MDLPRLNSDTALEAISGVQPELQNTRNDSEIFSKFSFDLLFLFQHSTLSWNRNVQQTKKLSLISIEQNLIAEFLDNDPKRSLDGILGPMPQSNSLFKGLVFLLTCTIPMKKARSIKVCKQN